METTPTELTELLVNRSAIGECEVNTSPILTLGDGQIRVAVERYSLTANTLTYAQFGDMLDYWGFYPTTAKAGWGKVPAIGYGRVVESNVSGIDVGGRYFGWFPQANVVDFAAAPSSSGFRDDGPHRANHAPAYRSFVRTDLDGSYTNEADEDRHLLLRGLFVTGFLIDTFFGARNYFGASQAIVLSASSKTALGYAYAVRQAGDRSVRVVGVTSANNLAWVRSIGVYDDLVTYDELDAIANEPSVIVDMAGSPTATAALHGRLGDAIKHSMVVGKSHHDAAPAAVVGGPTPELFFAPTAMADANIGWGSDEFARRTSDGVAAFIDGSQTWLTIEHHSGPAAAVAAWDRLFAGTVPPSIGTIASV